MIYSNSKCTSCVISHNVCTYFLKGIIVAAIHTRENAQKTRVAGNNRHLDTTVLTSTGDTTVHVTADRTFWRSLRAAPLPMNTGRTAFSPPTSTSLTKDGRHIGQKTNIKGAVRKTRRSLRQGC